MIETLKPQYSVFRRAGLEPREYSQILLQIGSLAGALLVSNRAFPSNTPRNAFSWEFILAPAEQHRKDMAANGWCPFVISILSESVCVLGYASGCKPFVRESSEGHTKCSMNGCNVNTMDTNNYSAKHVAKACECEQYEPVFENIVESLSAGKIPVIEYPPPQNSSNPTIEVVPYVAISHVWADGLGSTTEEGLPSCQIERLTAMTSQSVPGGAFWIDSLCVPKLRGRRKRAIGLMAQTYRDALAVLVIDSGIRSTTLSAPREEKLLRVLSSGWMQRLWTAQEGLLAKKLIFEFSGGLVPLEELLPVGEEHFDATLVYLASEVFRLKKYTASALSISDVSTFLRWRTTSRAADETLTISGLLNVSALELVNLPPENRMVTFLLRIQKLPTNIILLSGAKLNTPGFKWAPKTLMRGNSSSLSYTGCDASCTPMGLLAEYMAVYFQDYTFNKADEWYIRNSTNQRIFKVTDLRLDSNAEEIGYPITYSCNAILLANLPKPSETTVCAVVLVDRTRHQACAEEPAHGRDQFVCEFKKRLLVKDIGEPEFSREKVALTVSAKSGRMSVKVV